MTNEEAVYMRHMNLKTAASELGVKWQSLYSRLRTAGVKVAGDKLRYGSDRDRLGALAEVEFKRLVPAAIDNNKDKFQAKVDFVVRGHLVDVKASHLRRLSKKHDALSWSFSFKKQSLVADFIVCFCIGEAKQTEHLLLVPSEFFHGLQTVSVSASGRSKWLDYAVDPLDLAKFFDSLPLGGATPKQ